LNFFNKGLLKSGRPAKKWYISKPSIKYYLNIIIPPWLARLSGPHIENGKYIYLIYMPLVRDFSRHFPGQESSVLRKIFCRLSPSAEG